jgi:hypothetical protein
MAEVMTIVSARLYSLHTVSGGNAIMHLGRELATGVVEEASEIGDEGAERVTETEPKRPAEAASGQPSPDSRRDAWAGFRR